jgi:hypothetical protein
MSISLKAPPVTAAHRKELESHKANLEAAIGAAAQQSEQVVELATKERALERRTASLKRRAAEFDLAAETELTSTIKQIERIQIAQREAHSTASSVKPAFFKAISEAQELVQKVCQTSYQELLEKIAEALAPFHTDFARAKQQAREFPAVNDFGRTVMAHQLLGDESMERCDAAARETLAKVNALLDGSEIWTFSGCFAPLQKRKLAA